MNLTSDNDYSYRIPSVGCWVRINHEKYGSLQFKSIGGYNPQRVGGFRIMYHRSQLDKFKDFLDKLEEDEYQFSDGVEAFVIPPPISETKLTSSTSTTPTDLATDEAKFATQ